MVRAQLIVPEFALWPSVNERVPTCPCDSHDAFYKANENFRPAGSRAWQEMSIKRYFNAKHFFTKAMSLLALMQSPHATTSTSAVDGFRNILIREADNRRSRDRLYFMSICQLTHQKYQRYMLSRPDRRREANAA